MRNILFAQLFFSLGNAFLGIFYPFLLMEKFSLSFVEIIFVMAVQYGLMGFLVYPVNKLFLDIRKKLSGGIFLLALSYFFLSIIPENTFFLCLWTFIAALQMSLLWTSYHWINITVIPTKKRGNFLGNAQAIIMFALVLGPVLSGLLIDNGYADTALFIAGGFYMLAMMFSLFIPLKKKSPTLKNFSKTKEFFMKQTCEKYFLQASVVEAVQSSSLILMYPILLKITLKNYAGMGAMFFVMGATEIISSKIFGHLTDKRSSKKMLQFGAIARCLDIAPRGLLAFFPNTSLAAFLSFSAGVLGPLFGVSFYAQMYSRAEKSSDTYTFLITREWILAGVRFLFLLTAAAGFHFFGVYALAVGLFVAGGLSFILRKM